MSSNDINADGTLSFEEFIQAMPANMVAISAEEHRMADIRRKFAEFDQDGSGTVTDAEAHQILEKELAFTPRQSAEMVAKFDQNGDGQLGFEEFVTFYSKVQDCVSQVKNMFSEYDKDNSGSISINEAQTMFGRLGLQEKDVAELVAKYDVDNDGELQYFEFVALLMNIV